MGRSRVGVAGFWGWRGLAVVLLAGALGGCTSGASSQSDSPSTSAAASPSTVVTTSAPVAAPAPAPAAAPALRGPGVGGDSVNPAGAILPNSSRTPGALNPAVSQADIGSTICVAGWTATVRPASSLTTRLKVQQLASGYAYHGDQAPGDYEEDHLISLELGGSPSAEANLWPEPYNSAEGARVKDRVENRLHTLVCNHTISLAVAQRAIASNWWNAYATYVGGVTDATPAAVPPAPAPTQVPAPAPAPAPVVAGNGATALCNDGTYSYAAHHQGACSQHGGVQVFYK